MPMRGEMRPIPPRSHARVAKLQSAWSMFAVVMSNQDLQYTALFSFIGLVATVALLAPIR